MTEGVVVFDPGNASVGDVSIVGRAARGRQELSTIYEYEMDIEVLGDGGFSDEAIDSLLTNPCRLAFATGGAYEVHGIIRELEMLSMRSADQAHYRLRIVPKLWFLTLTKRNRVFQDMSHLDIVKAVLAEHGLEAGSHVDDGCNGDYPACEYTVQHDESDFAFISRLMEHHGIHYHFQSNPDGELMVLGDDNSVFDSILGLETFTYSPTATEAETTIKSLRRFRRIRPETVQERDYNWRTPTTPLKFTHDVDTRTGHGIVDIYGEHVKGSADGDVVARIRAEQLMVTHDTFVMETSALELVPGARFELVGHPNPDLDQEYLVTSVSEGLQGGDARYVKTIECIPASVPYRPQRRVPWPRIDGLINAKIDGEARSTMAPIDEEGRYKVVIPGDENAMEGGRASRWIRRAQPSAGSGYGMHLPLHIGTECVIAHVNGDPDRPIIVGAVPNPQKMSPVTSANATQSRIRTSSGVLIELDDDC